MSSSTVRDVPQAGRRRNWLWATVGVLACMAGFAVATQVMEPVPQVGSQDGYPLAKPTSTVAVQRRDIVSVLAMSGKIVPNPDFDVVAPLQGVFTRNRKASGVLRAGTTVGWIKSGASRRAVTTPVAAAFVQAIVADGATVPVGLPLLTLRANGFGLRATVNDAMRYRLLAMTGRATAELERGPGPFDCPILGGPVAESDGAITVTCAPPAKLRVFPGLTGIIAANTGEAHDVLTLPVDAVAGSAERGQVYVADAAGTYSIRDVQLGITDGSFVEIRKGLAAADVVRMPPPSLTGPR
ncbi:hypothetical protein AB0B31_28290 [Catellatospora citrea]|uniref:hypothetical protein n=1 Tax=Catellatospora citrea TaxID=53366 RepID=UPI0033EE273D